MSTWFDDVRTANDLPEDLGESFYLFDSQRFALNLRRFKAAFSAHYPNVQVGYSYKTNYLPQACKIVDALGGFAEVVSEMEYDLALEVGVKPDRIIVNGPYHSEESIRRYLLNGSTFHIDSPYQLETLTSAVSTHPERTFSVGIRCNFDLFAGDSRFGIDVDSATFRQALDTVANLPQVRTFGLHCHYPNRDLQSFATRVNAMVDLVKRESIKVDYLDIGGGFFSSMSEELQAQFDGDIAGFSEYGKIVGEALAPHFTSGDSGPASSAPKLILEPGSALVADTMKFVARVIDIKSIRDKTVVITSGSRFNMGLLTSRVNHPFTRIPDADVTPLSLTGADITGFTCIEADVIHQGFSGELGVGDLLVFDNAGSYSVVFKPPFIRPNVAIFEQSGLAPVTLKSPESLDDILATYHLTGLPSVD